MTTPNTNKRSLRPLAIYFLSMTSVLLSMISNHFVSKTRDLYKKQNEELRKLYNAEVSERNDLKGHRDEAILAAGVGGYMCGVEGIPLEKFVGAIFPASMANGVTLMCARSVGLILMSSMIGSRGMRTKVMRCRCSVFEARVRTARCWCCAGVALRREWAIRRGGG